MGFYKDIQTLLIATSKDWRQRKTEVLISVDIKSRVSKESCSADCECENLVDSLGLKDYGSFRFICPVAR